MLKDFNQSRKSIKGVNYKGYDDFNSSDEGILIYLIFEDEPFEIEVSLNKNHKLQHIVLINETAKEQGTSYGEYIYYNNIKNNQYKDLINKTIKTLREEEYTIKEN